MEEYGFDFIGEIPIGEVTKRERIVFDYFVTVAGQEFNLGDLYETLEGIDSGDIYFPYDTRENPDVKMFKENNIIDDYGHRSWGAATKGNKFEEFFKTISDLYWNARV
jgi:hypothetical protein